MPGKVAERLEQHVSEGASCRDRVELTMDTRRATGGCGCSSGLRISTAPLLEPTIMEFTREAKDSKTLVTSVTQFLGLVRLEKQRSRYVVERIYERRKGFGMRA